MNRKQTEQQFFNHEFAKDSAETQPRFAVYDVNKAPNALYDSLLGQPGPVLEYGCGLGSRSFSLAQQGISVTGIDISDVAIHKAKQKAQHDGINNYTSFTVMDGEKLGFADNSFQLVCGTAIIHHLELKQAFSELQRVLKPNGRAVFIEPLGYNPFINLWRKLTPQYRTPDEHPLLAPDIKLANTYFHTVKTHFFSLTTLGATPFRHQPWFNSLLNGLIELDNLLLQIPILKWQAWIVVLELSQPKK